MKSTPKVSGDRTLMAIVYKIISQKVLGFIFYGGGRKYCTRRSVYLVTPIIIIMFIFTPFFVLT